jgi:hypothetical protein
MINTSDVKQNSLGMLGKGFGGGMVLTLRETSN